MREQKRRILDEKTKGLYVELPRSQYENLKKYCFDNNMSKAYLITNLIEEKLEKTGFYQKKRGNPKLEARSKPKMAGETKTKKRRK